MFQRMPTVDIELSLQERMDAAFDNYLKLSRILEADMTALLDGECEDQPQQRSGDPHQQRQQQAVAERPQVLPRSDR